MRIVCFCTVMTLTGCSSFMPGIEDVLEDYVTEEAIQVTVDKAAIRDNTDVQIDVKVTNASSRLR